MIKRLHLPQFFRISLLSLPLLLCGFGQASAQTRELTPVEFRTLAWSGAIRELFYQINGEEYELEAVSAARSGEHYRAFAELPVEFYIKRQVPDVGIVNEKVGQVNFGNYGKLALLIIVQNPDDTYQFIATSDTYSDFPLGSFRFLNASEFPLAAALAEQRIMIQPGKFETLIPRSIGGSQVLSLKLGAMLDEPKLVYSSNWRSPKDERYLFIVTETGNERRPVKIKKIVERSVTTE